MLLDNPVILKEFIQASHRRRTYLLRTALPLVAMFIGMPALLAIRLSQNGGWRAVSAAVRPFFATAAWLQLIVFSLLAMAYCVAVLREEWRKRTVEVLCATPLTAAQIVLGKYFSVMGRLVLLGLALLPVMTMAFILGVVPPELAWSALGTVFASSVLCGAVALLSASLSRHQRGRLDVLGVLPFAYWVIVPLLGVATSSPVLIAAVPPWAMAYLMKWQSPTGGSPTGFALMAVFVPLLISFPMVAVTPLLFRRSFLHSLGEGKGGTDSAKILGRLLFLKSKRRPRLGDDENPFAWRERGGMARNLSLPIYLIYALVLAYVGVRLLGRISAAGFYPQFFTSLAWTGNLALCVTALVYGLSMFTREKERNTAEALILTGCKPKTIYAGKLRALYRGLAPGLCLVAGCWLLSWIGAGPSVSDEVALFLGIVSLVLGPYTAAVIGMTFSSTAKSTAGAFAGVILSPLFAWGASIVLLIPLAILGFIGGAFSLLVGLAICIAALAGVYKAVRIWRTWHLSLMFGLSWVFLAQIAAGMAFLGAGIFSAGGAALGFLLFAGVTLLFFSALWHALGIRIFESAMIGIPMPSAFYGPGTFVAASHYRQGPRRPADPFHTPRPRRPAPPPDDKGPIIWGDYGKDRDRKY